MGKSVNAAGVKAALKAASSSSSDSSSSSSSDSDKKKTVAKPAAKVVATPAKRKASSSDSSSSSSSEDEKPAAKKAAVAAPVKATPAKKAASSSSSTSSSSDDEKPSPKKVAAPVATPAKKKAASSSSSSSSSSDDEAPKKAAAPVAAKKSPAAKPTPAPKKAASSSSSSSSSSDDEKPAAKPVAAKRKRESSSSSSSSSDSDDEKPAAKASAPKDDFSALKKQKTETGAVAVVTANGGASNTIFVGGLSFDAGEEDVKAFFSEFGAVVNVRIPVHSDTGRKKGMAFVEFDSPAAATAALVKDQADMMGRYLNVSLSTSAGRPSTAPRSQELSERPAGCKTIFVGNLSWQATEDSLREAFAECGDINNIRIAWDHDNDRSKGFGHVEFETEEAVDLAIKCAGKEVAGRGIRVDYAPVRERKSFGGDGGGRGGGRGGFGGGRGGATPRGGRGGARGGFGGSATPNKAKGTMAGFSGKKVSFD